MNTRNWARGIAVLAPAAFCIAILAGIFVPIYTDEIGWRLQERAGLDGVDKLYSLLCGPTSLARPPLWMMPVRHYSAFWNVQFAAPLYTRISGLIYALVWGALLGRLIWRLAPDPERRRVLIALAFGLLSFGLLPWLLIWSRPEQPILLCTTAAILIGCRTSADRAIGGTAAWLRALGIVVLAGIALSYHLKAVFLLPVFATCIAVSSRGRANLVARIASGALLAGLILQGARYWVGRLHCPVDRGFLQSQNLGSELVSSRSVAEAGGVLVRMLGNINPFPYLWGTTPRPDLMSGWIAEWQVGIPATLAWWLAVTFTWSLSFLLAGDVLLRQVRSGRRDGFDPRVPVVAALLVSIVGWSATQVVRNDYESALMVPLMLLAVVISLSCAGASSSVLAGVRGLALGTALGAVVSMTLIAWVYTPSLAAAFGERGYVSEQPHSVSAFGYEPLRQRILALAKTCGIVPGRSRNLVVDDVTYYPLMTSLTPDHASGRFGLGAQERLSLDYLRARDSSGVIAACRKIPGALRARARVDGELCCLAPFWRGAVTGPAK